METTEDKLAEHTKRAIDHIELYPDLAEGTVLSLVDDVVEILRQHYNGLIQSSSVYTEYAYKGLSK